MTNGLEVTDFFNVIQTLFYGTKRRRSGLLIYADDAKRSGSPIEVTPENIQKVHHIVSENQKVEMLIIANTLKISEGSFNTILFENSENIKESKSCSKLVNRNKKGFLHRYVQWMNRGFFNTLWSIAISVEYNRQSAG